ncbi:hypothetical protein Tco_0644350 [Tanacetum coccineum]
MNSSEPTLSIRPTNVEVPKELPKVSMVNTSLKKLKHHLANFDVVVKERTTPTAIDSQTKTQVCLLCEVILKQIPAFNFFCASFESITAIEITWKWVKEGDDTPLKDLFSTFNQHLVDELFEVQNVFYQMEQAVEQHRIESKTFEVKMNQVLNENEQLLEQVMSRDIVNLLVNSSVDNDSVNVHESGPNWLFDIDALTKSMNYKPVAAGNQSNGSAGTKACDNSGKARVETEDNVVDKNIVYGCVDDLNMPNLEDIVYSDDDEDVGADADMNNLDTFIPISPIPTTRIHKDLL